MSMLNRYLSVDANLRCAKAFACVTASESLLDAILRFDAHDVVLLDAILEHFDVCDVLTSWSSFFPLLLLGGSKICNP